MSNLQFTAKGMTDFISRITPASIVILAILSFLAMGIFHFDFLSQIMGNRLSPGVVVFMAAMGALLISGSRFIALMASARDFANGNQWGGWIGLVGSVALLAYELTTVGKMAEMWTEYAAHMANYLRFAIILGFGLELRLILSVAGITTDEDTEELKQKQSQKKHRSTPDVEQPQSVADVFQNLKNGSQNGFFEFAETEDITGK